MGDVENQEKASDARLSRIERALATYQSDPEVGSISAMPVLIDYVAVWGEFRHYKRGEEHVFEVANFESGHKDETGYEPEWETSRQNAFLIRDDFLKIKTPMEAFDFLNRTGPFFWPDVCVTWSFFQRWQRFAYLAEEHFLLASAMKNGQFDGECGEALKALSGDDQNTFFEGTDLLMRERETERLARLKHSHPSLAEEQARQNEEALRKLWGWFRQPPDEACSIEWIPKSEAEWAAVDPLIAEGDLIEFLIPQANMRPVLYIRPKHTLEAIAAAIFADRIRGVEYRTCEVCSDLFEVGTRGEKKYCSRERCKNTAHQRRMRANRTNARKKKTIQTEREA